MDDIQQTKIRDNFYTLIESTNVSLTFLSHFRTHDIFSLSDIKAITALNDDLDPMDQAYQFYKRVLRSSFNAFDLLIAALAKTNQLTLSNLLSTKAAPDTKEKEDSTTFPVLPTTNHDVTIHPPPTAATVPEEQPVLTNAVVKIKRLSPVHLPPAEIQDSPETLPQDEKTPGVPLCVVDADTEVSNQPNLGQQECFVCFKTFKCETTFQSHLKRRLNRKIKCRKCEKAFSQQCQLNQHLRKKLCNQKSKTDVEGKSEPVKKTNPTVSLNIKKRRGARQPGNKQNVHTCLFCDKHFTKKHILDLHLLIHTQERPFSCDICSNTFTAPSTLTRHLATHKNEKPFDCKTCGRRFSLKQSLNSHSLVHSEKRPHKCLICEKHFKRTMELKLHLLSHSTVTFKCNLCSYQGNRQDYLQKHKKRCHRVTAFRCGICSKTFLKKESLKRHINTH